FYKALPRKATPCGERKVPDRSRYLSQHYFWIVQCVFHVHYDCSPAPSPPDNVPPSLPPSDSPPSLVPVSPELSEPSPPSLGGEDSGVSGGVGGVSGVSRGISRDVLLDSPLPSFSEFPSEPSPESSPASGF